MVMRDDVAADERVYMQHSMLIEVGKAFLHIDDVCVYVYLRFLCRF